MKKLFVVLAFITCGAEFHAAPAKPKTEAAPAAAPATVAPAPEKPRKPGFWERAWDSTKKSTRTVGRVVTRPFGGSKKEKGDESQVGWRNLAMTLTLDPTSVKLPETKAIKVTFAVVNKGTDAVQLEFPSTQRIEVLLKNDSGKVLSKWSDDQKVEPEEGFLVINPEERLEYTANVSTREMAAGNTYIVEAYFPNFDQLRASQMISPTK
jgi:hypothetical protein